MNFEVRLHPDAARFLDGLDSKTKERIKDSLYQLREDPVRSRPKADIKKLKGTKGRQDLYRLRVGEYRIIYGVENRTVWVTDIFRRDRGYRGI